MSARDLEVTGTLGAWNPDVEGTDETRRAHREAGLRDARVLAARRSDWRELDTEHLEPYTGAPQYRGTYSYRDGFLYEPLRLEVWAGGDPRAEFNTDHVYSGSRRVAGLYVRTKADGSIVYDVALRLGGKVRRHRLTAATKTDAIAELRALQTDYRRGEEYRSPAAAVTVSELVADFIRHMRTRVGDPDPKRRRAPRTVEHYEYVLGRYVEPVIGSTPVPDVTVRDIRRVLDTMAARKLSPSTRTGTMTALSAAFRYAVKQGVAERNVVRDLDRDDRPGAARLTEPRYLTLDELRRLLAAMGDTFRPIAATCAYAGLRASEALGPRWRDVDFNAGTLTVTGQLGITGERIPAKTAASVGTVPMLPSLVLELRRHRRKQALRNLALVGREALVFTTATGRPQSHRNALRAVHEAGDRAKLNGDERPPVGLHDLRHSFVALALASGLTLPEVSALARHANPRITAMAYAGLTDEGRAKLGEKLASAFER